MNQNKQNNLRIVNQTDLSEDKLCGIFIPEGIGIALCWKGAVQKSTALFKKKQQNPTMI